MCTAFSVYMCVHENMWASKHSAILAIHCNSRHAHQLSNTHYCLHAISSLIFSRCPIFCHVQYSEAEEGLVSCMSWLIMSHVFPIHVDVHVHYSPLEMSYTWFNHKCVYSKGVQKSATYLFPAKSIWFLPPQFPAQDFLRAR